MTLVSGLSLTNRFQKEGVIFEEEEEKEKELNDWKTTFDGGTLLSLSLSLTKYCNSPGVKPAAKGAGHKISQIKYRPISL